MPTRCFWPPDSWRGMRSANARGSLTRSSSSSMRARRVGLAAADAELLQRADDLAADRMRRVERVERVLEHHLDRRRRSWCRACWIGVLAIAWLSSVDVAGGRGLQAHQDLGQGRLAAAGFADDGQRLALARLEADRLVGLHQPRRAPPNKAFDADLVVLPQLVDPQHDVADLVARGRAPCAAAARPSRSRRRAGSGSRGGRRRRRGIIGMSRASQRPATK